MCFPCDSVLCVIVHIYVMTVFILYCHDDSMHDGYIYCYDVVSNMEKDRYTFRLSPENIRQLDELIEKGIIQNRTDGVIKGIAMLHAAELYKGPVHDLIFKETKSPELIHDWEKFPDGAEIPFYGIPGVKITVIKLGPQHVKIIREYSNGRTFINEAQVKTDGKAVISNSV